MTERVEEIRRLLAELDNHSADAEVPRRWVDDLLTALAQAERNLADKHALIQQYHAKELREGYGRLLAEVERLKKNFADRLDEGVAERDGLRAALARVRRALQELVDSCANPEFDDERIGYISVQVSREALKEARAVLEGR